jgi:hypothetical protein
MEQMQSVKTHFKVFVYFKRKHNSSSMKHQKKKGINPELGELITYNSL